MKGLKYYIYTQSNRNETQLPNHPYEMTSCQSNLDVYLPLNGHPGLPGKNGHSTVIYNPFVNRARNWAQLHLQKLPNGVVYRNQYIFRLPAEIWGIPGLPAPPSFKLCEICTCNCLDLITISGHDVNFCSDLSRRASEIQFSLALLQLSLALEKLFLIIL